MLSAIDLDIDAGARGAHRAVRFGQSTLLNLTPASTSPAACCANGPDIASLGEAGGLAGTRGASFSVLQPAAGAHRVRERELPLLLTRLTRRERREHAETALAMVGLSDRVKHYPSELSGGQQQRVAIARAIITDPEILVADEPTGDLDRVSAAEVLGLLERLNAQMGKTIVMVTHDQRAAEAAHRLIHLDKGVLINGRHAGAAHDAPASS